MRPRVSLCCLPTPCHSLGRLGHLLGLDLWVKRDDLTGFAGGGNKGRKLEFLIAEAVDQGATHVVTCGSSQSNFVRQLGAACSVFGLGCTAVVMDLPYDSGHGKPVGRFPQALGNLVLDDLFGVKRVLVPDDDWDVLFARTEAVARELTACSEKVYDVPIGGSSPLGAFSFTLAAEEVGDSWDFIVTPTSSGSTHAGLAWAFHGSRTRVVGVACDPEEDLRSELVRLAAGVDALTGCQKAMSDDEFELRTDYFGAGYNVWSKAGKDAIELLAKTEGLLLDPVYSSKAFACLLDLARNGELFGKVLFWHTGGLPTLLAATGESL